MSNLENDIKIESIFAITEVRRYIADVIDKNVEKYNLPLGEFDWSLAFLETYRNLKTGEDEEISEGQNHSTEICNYIIIHSNQHTFVFLKRLFILIALLEKNKIIESSEQFTGEMFASMFDPEGSYSEKESRDSIIKGINYIFNRHGWNIRFNNLLKKYVFEKLPEVLPIEKDAVFLYGDTIYISGKTLNYIDINLLTITLKTEPADIRILEHLIRHGKGNINNWLTKEDIANNLKLSMGTVSNSLSFFRTKVSKIVMMNLIEERGVDKDGKQYRINPKVLP